MSRDKTKTAAATGPADACGAYRIATVAEALDVSRTTVWDLVRRSEIEAFRLSASEKSPYRITRGAVLKAYGQDVADHCDRIEARSRRRS